MTVAEQILLAKDDYDAVFDAGYEKGKSEGGGDDYYNEFWDAYQQNGNRKSYAYAFQEWAIEAFNPKYNIVMEGNATNAFYKMKSNENKPFSITERLQQNGVILDTSKATDVSSMFLYYQGNSIPYLDFSSVTNSALVFFYAGKLVTIEGIKVTKNVKLNGVFTGCKALEHIRFEGEIGNDISFADSPLLSSASLESIVNSLSVASTGKSLTISKAAVNKAFETIEGANDGSTSAKWATLIGTRPNWTIVLI